jgi:Protein of unknown function (DUF3667)
MSARPAASSASRICMNCGTPLLGSHCHACGQRGEAQRFTLSRLLHEIPHAIFHVDHGFPATLRALATRPGRTIREYLDGKRARYFNPLTLLVILGGLCALGYSKYPFDFQYLANSMPAGRRADYADTLQVLFEYYTLSMMLQLPIASAITLVLFRKRGRSYGEHLVANAYIFAFMSLIGLAALPFYIATNGGPWFATAWMVSFFPYFVYQSWATYGAFASPQHRIGDALRALAASAAYILFSALLQGLFVAIYMGASNALR